jgi:hypothetical protein
MSSPLIPPRFFWVTQAGLPAVGYKLYSYAAGTSTPQATYPTAADADALTNANANPVVLDALGSASVWLTGAAYKFVLNDDLGNLIWTQDNVQQGGVAGGQRSSLQIAQESPLINAVDSAAVFWGLSTQAPVLDLDPKSEYSSATGRFTVKATGFYLISCSLQMLVNGATLRAGFSPTLGLQVNGVTVQQRVLGSPSATGTNNPITGALSKIVLLNPNDYVRAFTSVGWSAGTAPSFGYSWAMAQLF